MVQTATSPQLFGIADKYPLSSDVTSGLRNHGCTEREWQALLSGASLREVQQSQLLLREGDLVEGHRERELYLIAEGCGTLEVRGKRITTIKPGSFIGEASFLSGSKGPRSASLRCKDPSMQVLVWECPWLRDFLADPANQLLRSKLHAWWAEDLARKLHHTMGKVESMSLLGPDISDSHLDNQGTGHDYGYLKRHDADAEFSAAIPRPGLTLAWWNFRREYTALRRSIRYEELSGSNNPLVKVFMWADRALDSVVLPPLKPNRAYSGAQDDETKRLQAELRKLKLSNEAIAKREQVRMARTKELVESTSVEGVALAQKIRLTQTPWFVLGPYYALCAILDLVFEDRPIARFWFLETVARMPYFSYLSMLHLYETLGWWTVGDEVRRVHFAEEWNEAAHLSIMQSLGGDTRWTDRFLARHAAIVYYWLLNMCFIFSPFLAYNFSELIESHAVDTYSEFLEVNEELLKSLPPSTQAMRYYATGDLYLFDEFQTSRPAFSRRPIINNMYDVFCAIRDDEAEHVKTMFACERAETGVMSPNAAAAEASWMEEVAEDAKRDSTWDASETNKAGQMAEGAEEARDRVR